jgi:hypothetical protein
MNAAPSGSNVGAALLIMVRVTREVHEASPPFTYLVQRAGRLKINHRVVLQTLFNLSLRSLLTEALWIVGFTEVIVVSSTLKHHVLDGSGCRPKLEVAERGFARLRSPDSTQAETTI